MKKNKKVKQKLPIGYIGFNDEKTTKQKKNWQLGEKYNIGARIWR